MQLVRAACSQATRHVSAHAADVYLPADPAASARTRIIDRPQESCGPEHVSVGDVVAAGLVAVGGVTMTRRVGGDQRPEPSLHGPGSVALCATSSAELIADQSRSEVLTRIIDARRA